MRFDSIHTRAFAAPRSGGLIGALLFACLVPPVGLRGQEAATYKQIVITITSRALDKAHPDILSDTNYSVREQVFSTDAPDGSDFTDKSLGRRQPANATVARESFVYFRPNRLAAHVAVVSGSVSEAGIKRTVYGVGVGDTGGDAEGKAVAHLRSRLPGWSAAASPHEVVHRAELAPRTAPPSADLKLKRKALVYIAWKYVPEVGPSAQTDIGYAVAYNEDIQAAGNPSAEVTNVFSEIDDDELRRRNRETLDKLGAYKDVRSVSAELPLSSGMEVVIISAQVPTAKGPVLQVYGAGIGKDYLEATGKALKNLAGKSWGWSEAKHGYKEEYRRVIPPVSKDANGFLRIRPTQYSIGVRG